jgi:signal transduction histidine kinase
MADPDGLQGPESLPTLRSELRERSKELGFLHHATRLLHTRGEPLDTLRSVLELLPSAMCYPELAGARLCLGPLEVRTQVYEQSKLSLRAEFAVSGQGSGFVEVCYVAEPPSGPVFLEEEQSLLGSLAELLRGHFELMRAETDYQRLLQADAEQQSALADSRGKDQLLTSVAHELRSSLDEMLGWIQVLKQGARDPELSARGLDMLERNVTRQAKLVDQLLDPSRSAAGKPRRD